MGAEGDTIKEVQHFQAGCLTIVEGRNKLRACEMVRCEHRKSIFLDDVLGFAGCNAASARTAEET